MHSSLTLEAKKNGYWQGEKLSAANRSPNALDPPPPLSSISLVLQKIYDRFSTPPFQIWGFCSPYRAGPEDASGVSNYFFPQIRTKLSGGTEQSIHRITFLP